jgi:RNA polymerase sigma-70 factor (ECF subfamily)
MAEDDELELVNRCRAGEPGAFDELVDRYKGLVYALIVRSVDDRSRADDFAQEVFLRVHRGLPYFRGEARLSTWIYRIVANLCAQARGHQTAERPLDEETVGTAGRQFGAAETAFGSLELRDRLEKAIARLPTRDRLLIAGHYVKGLRYEDLAEALGMPVGTVKTHLYRAKRKLRELLQGELR